MDIKITDIKLIRNKPVYAVLMSFTFVLISFVSSLLIFPSALSIVMITLSSLFILPFVIKIFEFDELNVDVDDTNKEELKKWVRKCLRDGFTPKQIKDNLIRNNIDKPYELIYDLTGVDREYLKFIKASNVFSRHKDTIYFYIFLFIGMFFGYFFLFSFLPQDLAEMAFQNQLDIIPSSRGYFSTLPSYSPLFWNIVANNLRLVIICVLLSLVYGSGAVFILNYNASIAGVLYGSSLRALLAGIVTGGGILSNPLVYLPHTSLEIFAYLLAAISGGVLLKIIMVQQEPGSSKILVRDSTFLLVISVIFDFYCRLC
jgi:uncharacterized membrane protein SpoIIM required for sporulation